MERHDLTPGGEVTYFMTSPEGEKLRGWWRVTAVDPPNSLEVVDGFDENGAPNRDLPTTTMHVQINERDGGARMTMRSVFGSAEQMEELASMGMIEGIRQAVGQMDALLT